MKKNHKQAINNFLLLNEKNLGKQSLFWFAIIIPVISFVFFSIPLWLHTEFSFNAQGYTKFLSDFKLPLYALGTCVPLVAIVVYIHRTIQTEKQIQHTLTQIDTSQLQLKNTLTQIQITEKKNFADSYYAHSKYIIEALNSLPKKSIEYTIGRDFNAKENIIFSQPHSLYKRIFFKSSIENGYISDINPEIPYKLDLYYKKINKAIFSANHNRGNKNSQLESLSHIDNYIQQICDLLSLEYTPSNHLFYISSENEILVTSFCREEQIKSMLNFLYHTIQRVSDLTGMDAGYLNDFSENNLYSDILYYMSSSANSLELVLPTASRAEQGEILGTRSERSGVKMAAHDAKRD